MKTILARIRKKRTKIRLSALVFLTALSLPHEFVITRKYPPVDLNNKSLTQAIIEYENKYGKTPESMKIRVLREYFTPNAFEQLKDIPICEGNIPPLARATGRSPLEMYFQNWFGYGYTRRTIINPEAKLETKTIIHENIHHASALGLIDDDEFANAWEQMYKNKATANIADEINQIIDENYSIIIRTLQSRRLLEQEAYLSQHYLQNRSILPPEIRRIYEQILK